MSCQRPSRASRATTTIALLLWVLASLPGFCQAASEEQVKAAYLYSFAKFIEWPSRSFQGPSAPFHFCVVNNRSFQAELERTVKGKSVAGRTIEVASVLDTEQSRSCHLLFVDASQERQSRHILQALHGATILIVGETRNFIEGGGTIGFLMEDEHVYFEINQKEATLAGLYVSSRLLSVAKRVIQ